MFCVQCSVHRSSVQRSSTRPRRWFSRRAGPRHQHRQAFSWRVETRPRNRRWFSRRAKTRPRNRRVLLSPRSTALPKTHRNQSEGRWVGGQEEVYYCSVPEFIDPVSTKASPKRSFSMTKSERFGLVFGKTGSINSGTGGLCRLPDAPKAPILQL